MFGQDDEIEKTVKELLESSDRVLAMAKESFEDGNFSEAYFRLQVVENVTASLKYFASAKATADVGVSLLGTDVAAQTEEFLRGKDV